MTALPLAAKIIEVSNRRPSELEELRREAAEDALRARPGEEARARDEEGAARRRKSSSGVVARS